MAIVVSVTVTDTNTDESRRYVRAPFNDNPNLYPADLRTMLEDIQLQFVREEPFNTRRSQA